MDASLPNYPISTTISYPISFLTFVAVLIASVDLFWSYPFYLCLPLRISFLSFEYQ